MGGRRAGMREEITMERIAEVLYFPSLRCNLNCRHCGEKQDIPKEQEMDGRLVIRQIAQSTLVRKQRVISVSGGEPFLNETLPGFILDGMEQTDHSFAVTSNGYFYEKIKELVQTIRDRDKERIRFHISIDGCKETHNKIRRNPDSFQRAVRTLDSLAQFGIPCSINTVVQPDNAEELADFQEYFTRRHPYAKINFIPYAPDIGGGIKGLMNFITKHFREKYGHTWNIAWIRKKCWQKGHTA